MSRVVFVVSLVLLAFGGPLAAAISNAGFETGDGGAPSDPANWTEYGPDLTGERSSQFSRSGSYSAKRWTGGDFQEYGYYQDFAADPGMEYSLKAYLHSPASDALSGSSYACTRLEFRNAQGQTLLQRESRRLRASNSSFEQCVVTAVAPQEAVSGRVIYAVGAGAAPHGGAAYCDDVELSGLGTTPAEDDGLLDQLQKRIFDFFWQEAGPLGLIKDRAGNFRQDSYTHSSIASVGFGLAVICLAESRGWVSREDAEERIRLTLNTFATKVSSDSGFFHHFLNSNTGQAMPGSEVSTIDTALLLYGAMFAGSYFEDRYSDTAIRDAADTLYRKVNWPQRYSGSSVYSEYMMMDLLAMASPTYPLPASVWNGFARNYRDNLATRPLDSSYPRFFYPVLFVHQYPQCYLDLRFRRDAFSTALTYFQSTRNHTLSNRQYCIDHSASAGFASPMYQTYSENCWGLTAGDGPDGYRDYGEALPWLPEPQGTWLLDGTVLPHAAGGSVAFAPEVCIPALRWMRQAHAPRIWGRYGFSDAYNVDRNWWADDVIGIDVGAMFLSIENYRTGAAWRYTMRVPAIRRAMDLAGLTLNRHPSYEDFGSAPPTVWGGDCGLQWGTGQLSYVDEQDDWAGGRATRVSTAAAGGGAAICLNSLDLTYDDAVSFHVRGEAGGESVIVGLTDTDGRQASVDLADYLPDQAVTAKWQAAFIPLRAFTGIRLPSVQRVSFTLSQPSTVILLDDLAFTGSHPDAGALNAASIGAAAGLPPGTTVWASGAVVTENFGTFMYVAQPDRSAGLRIVPAGAYTPGDVLTVRGVLASVDGDTALTAATAARSGKVAPLAPLGMSAGSIGRSAPETVGLRIRSWGVVASVAVDEFEVRDGSGRTLVVLAPALPKPAQGAFVTVTGISGYRMAGDARQPVLRVRSPWDIVTVQ